MTTKSLQQAITLIKSGDKQNGKRLLAEILKANPKNETAWLWMSSILDKDDQRRHCLEQVLAVNPDNQLAKKGLAKLQQPLYHRNQGFVVFHFPAIQAAVDNVITHRSQVRGEKIL